ncbi:Hpt domain-containing protein [Vibrio hangzhouensis]|uniref:Hpt domain-containing protein n=1 Tax=Vibrio hangzhouensis TaxID=462991 RepID=UPI001C94FB09|nr:Hpt domain-containing protein [Vibrio hangzhouensis]MBY6196466.1 Hpt domain-containing protein [Vibrio hangzhouensis]
MINFDVLRSYMDDDEDIIQAVFTAFLEEHEDGSDKIQSYYTSQNWSDLFLTAHSLKGILSSFGESDTVARLQSIENATRDGVAPHEDDVQHVIKGLAVIKQQIIEYLASAD